MITKRKYFLCILLLSSLLTVVFWATSCSNADKTIEAKTHTAGPERIVSLAPSVTEILFSIGAGDKIVGVTRYCKYPPETDSITKVGGLLDLNYETLIELDPDLAIITDTSLEAKNNLEKLNINVLAVPNETIGDLLVSIEKIGMATGKIDEARSLSENISSSISEAEIAARDIVRKKKVMIVVDRNPGSIQSIFVAGKHTFFSELLEAAGAINVFDDSNIKYPEPSLEEIILRNPDIIIETRIGYTGAGEALIREWDTLEELEAVKTGNIFIWTDSYTSIPGPRIVRLLSDIQNVINGKND
ncbi:MAG TPA: helical backbone metal receptor [bacterium]|nr:helical backbone metal receptor [bacterium]